MPLGTAMPRVELEITVVIAELRRRRHVGQEARALRVHDRQRAHLARLDAPDDAADVVERHVDVAAQDRRSSAPRRPRGARCGKSRPAPLPPVIRIARWSSLRMPVVAALILLGVLLRGLEQVLEGLVRAVGLDPDDAGIEHLVDHRNEGVGLERRLALRVEDDGVQRGQVDEADVVAVGPLPGSCRSSPPGRPPRPCSPPRWSGRGPSRRSPRRCAPRRRCCRPPDRPPSAAPAWWESSPPRRGRASAIERQRDINASRCDCVRCIMVSSFVGCYRIRANIRFCPSMAFSAAILSAETTMISAAQTSSVAEMGRVRKMPKSPAGHLERGAQRFLHERARGSAPAPPARAASRACAASSR